jgi:hypothetical protein
MRKRLRSSNEGTFLAESQYQAERSLQEKRRVSRLKLRVE